tara:strand:- start:112 stop:789 length:678 start_codon:yes stop_codon:yes gene_type:complete
MKKLTIALVLLSFLGFNAQADISVGLKVTSANLQADGSETQNSGALVTQKEREADFEIASVFAEKGLDLGIVDLSLGVEIIPFEREVAVLGGGTGFDATISVGNLVSAYIQPMLLSNGDATLYIKAGYATADLEIDKISRQATATAVSTGAASDSASTDGAQTRDLEGPLYGIGVQIAMDNFVDSIRIEATRHDFDKITYTNSNSKKLTADAAMDSLSIGLVKSF